MQNTVTKFRHPRVLVVLCALTVLSGAGVFARTGGAALLRRAVAPVEAGRPEITVALTGTVAREDKQLALDKVEAVRPGELLTWTITSQNDGTAAARSYSTIGQIPQGTTFVAGSAAAPGTTVTYSIDSGKTYSAKPIVAERQPDGSFKEVAAPVSMYTQVRYEWADPLAADATLSASYKVRVR